MIRLKISLVMNNGIILVISDEQLISIHHSGSVSFKEYLHYHCFCDKMLRAGTAVGIRAGLRLDFPSFFSRSQAFIK